MSHSKLHGYHLQDKVNKVIWFLTGSDIFVWGAVSVGAPLVAIYLTSKFGAQTVEYIGIGTAVYYLLRGLTQIPLGTITDRIKSDHDEIALLITGCILMSIPYFFYQHVTLPWHYYILQALAGLGASLNLNNWRKLFAKNVEKNKEGFAYGFYETVMSISTAIFGVVGGYLSGINTQIFELVIMMIGVFVISGGLLSAGIYSVHKRRSELRS